MAAASMAAMSDDDSDRGSPFLRERIAVADTLGPSRDSLVALSMLSSSAPRLNSDAIVPRAEVSEGLNGKTPLRKRVYWRSIFAHIVLINIQPDFVLASAHQLVAFVE